MSLHDKLQAQAYQWAHNRFPQIKGHLFAARSEVVRYPGETEKAFLARLGHLKSIGHRKGILDLHLDLPEWKGKPGKPFEFDAKVKPDYLKPDQLERIAMMQKCGGDGWAFYSFDEFKNRFNKIMADQFGADLIIIEVAEQYEAKEKAKADRAAKKKWVNDMRKTI